MTVQTTPASTIDEGVHNLIDASISDYVDWKTRSIQHHIDRDGREGYWPKTRDEAIEEFRHSFRVTHGKKYTRISKITGSQQCVHAFVVAVADDNKFRLGDVLKPDGWKTPARNKARGNVIEGNYPMQWTGPLYL